MKQCAEAAPECFEMETEMKITSYLTAAALAVALVATLVPASDSYSSYGDAQPAGETEQASDADGAEIGIEATAAQQSTTQQSMTQTASSSQQIFVRNGNDRINELIEDYCAALKSGDETQLAKCTDSIDGIDIQYRSIYARYVDDITDINCYTMAGMLADTYIVFVTYNVKYTGFDTVLPATMKCYVCTDASGNLYVSNKEQGDDVSSYNEMMYKSSQITDIIAKIAAEHDAGLDADEELAAFVAGFKEYE